MVLRTRPIVRPDSENRMVTKGYQKGVYDRVTEGTERRSLKRCKLTPIRKKSMQTPKQRRQSNRLISNIDTIGLASAMLAVLFVLLLSFMTISPDSGNHGRDVDLAKVLHPISMPGARREDAIIIAVTRDGKLYLGTDEVGVSELPIKINEMMKSGSPKVAYFKVDGRARYRHLRDALDSVRSIGLQKIAFLVEEQKTKQ